MKRIFGRSAANTPVRQKRTLNKRSSFMVTTQSEEKSAFRANEFFA
jgi:hypothetical protein